MVYRYGEERQLHISMIRWLLLADEHSGTGASPQNKVKSDVEAALRYSKKNEG